MTSALNPLLGFAAGALTILSPCVLPLVPIVLGSAAQKHRAGPLALAAGLVASFTVVGLGLATIGASAGLDGEVFRPVGAALLVLAGFVLLMPALQDRLATVAAPVAGWAQQRQSGLERFGLAGQAAIGALLGLVWSPCVGPTLGAATVLAADGKSLGQVALVMFAFGLGISSVLVVIGFAARAWFLRNRGKLLSAGAGGKKALGILLLVVGAAILSGLDRLLEGVILSIQPDWLVDLTVSV